MKVSLVSKFENAEHFTSLATNDINAQHTTSAETVKTVSFDCISMDVRFICPYVMTQATKKQQYFCHSCLWENQQRNQKLGTNLRYGDRVIYYGKTSGSKYSQKANTEISRNSRFKIKWNGNFWNIWVYRARLHSYQKIPISAPPLTS